MNVKTITLSGLMLLGICTPDAYAKRSVFVSATKKANTLSKYNTRDQNIIAFRKQMAAFKKTNEKVYLPTAKTTALNSRLIAEGYREYSGSAFQLLDTVHAKYSGSRGGDLTTSEIKFDTLRYYDASSGSPVLGSMQIQLFDLNDNIISSKSKEWDGASLVDVSQNFSTYNADNKQVKDSAQDWTGSAWENSSLTEKTYTATKMIATETYKDWDGSAWENSALYKYTYTAADKLASMEIQFWTGTAWTPFVKVTNTYDAVAGTLTSELTQIDMSGSGTLDDYARTTYAYDAAKNAISEDYEEWNATDSKWENSYTVLNTFDAAANKLTAIECYRDDVSGAITDTFMRNTFTYNTYKQVRTDATQQWNPTTHAFETTTDDYQDTYYYEEYAPASIKDDRSSVAGLNIYPVPARDILNITADLQSAQTVTISMTDMQGRVMQTASVAPTAHLRATISVANIPSGNYFIQILGDKGAKVARQIVVTH